MFDEIFFAFLIGGWIEFVHIIAIFIEIMSCL